jgi:phosphate transport system substrate-binding protein
MTLPSDQVDFGASDIPYSSNQATNVPTVPYQYMPDVAGALAFMYNLTGQNGSDGVANYVSALSSEGSIGYLETAYAIQHNFPVASLVNASGAAVQPTSFNDATALTKAILFADLTQNLANVYSNPAANAYPVSAYSYFVAPCSPSLAAAQSFNCTGPQGTSPFGADRGAELGQFIAFVACAGQEKMALLGYSPLPPNLVQEDFNAIGRLNGGVQPPAPTAANCHNPYVDGEQVLPGGGGPTIDTQVQDANSNQANVVTKEAATANQVPTTTPGATIPGAGSTTGGPSTVGTHTASPTGPATILQSGRSVQYSNLSALGSPFTRLDTLQQVAAKAHGPSLPLILLWCLVLALMLTGPPLGRLAFRRGRRSGAADLTSIRGDAP